HEAARGRSDGFLYRRKLIKVIVVGNVLETCQCFIDFESIARALVRRGFDQARDFGLVDDCGCRRIQLAVKKSSGSYRTRENRPAHEKPTVQINLLIRDLASFNALWLFDQHLILSIERLICLHRHYAATWSAGLRSFTILLNPGVSN